VRYYPTAGDTFMKKFARLLVVTLLLTFATSTVSLADGGAPPPKCSPAAC
jgi:hypothetical protein